MSTQHKQVCEKVRWNRNVYWRIQSLQHKTAWHKKIWRERRQGRSEKVRILYKKIGDNQATKRKIYYIMLRNRFCEELGKSIREGNQENDSRATIRQKCAPKRREAEEECGKGLAGKLESWLRRRRQVDIHTHTHTRADSQTD